MESLSPSVRAACGNCRAAHKGCNRVGPPCQRCVEFGLERSCVFPKEKKHQRHSATPRPFGSPRGAASPLKARKGRPPKYARRRPPDIEDETFYLKDHLHSPFGFPPLASTTTKLKVISPEADEELHHEIAEHGQVWSILPSRKALQPLDTTVAALAAKMTLPKISVRELDDSWSQSQAEDKHQKEEEEDEEEDQLTVKANGHHNSHSKWDRPATYILYQEKSPEELDNFVEYDVESEDEVWLAECNQQRHAKGLQPITEDEFERMIDRLEKEAFIRECERSIPPPEDIDNENTNCCICSDGTSDDTNQIVFCDGCDIAVHQECYGIRYIPEGLWFCKKCELKAEGATCALCPNGGGALKKSSQGQWAHIVCALFIPETSFNIDISTGMRGEIEGIENIPKARWNLVCELCKKKEGAPIQCKDKSCTSAFHVTCAQSHRLFMETRERFDRVTHRVACMKHSPKKYQKIIKQELARKVAYGRNKESTGVKRKFLDVFGHETISLKQAEAAIDERAKKSVSAVWKYWVDKRKSRSGNPLIKRLSKAILFSPRAMAEKENRIIIKETGGIEKLQSLRRDLEKCRILLELIKKREHCKLQRVEVVRDLLELQTNPLSYSLRPLLDFFEREDKNGFFKEELVEPRAEAFISLQTMRERLNQNSYSQLAEFWEDFETMCTNARATYESDHPVYIEAKRLQDLKEDICEKIDLPDDQWRKLLDSEKSNEVVKRKEAKVKGEKRKERDSPSGQQRKKRRTVTELQQALSKVLEQLRRVDKHEIFAELVDPKEVPDYYGVIKHPMAFSKMQQNLESGVYKTPQHFRDDLRLIIGNALIFNQPSTIFYKEAKRLQWMGAHFLDKLELLEEEERDPDLTCSNCGKNDQRKVFVVCGGCSRGFHTLCLNPPLKTAPKDWFFCSNCDPSKHCNICGKDDDDPSILLCDGCDEGFHLYCLTPPKTDIPKGKWFCPSCDPAARCHLCGKEDDDSKMILCDTCDKGFHVYCLKPSLVNIPKGGWHCVDCAEQHKATNSPSVQVKSLSTKQNASSANGSLTPRLLGACEEHKRRKKRCLPGCAGRTLQGSSSSRIKKKTSNLHWVLRKRASDGISEIEEESSTESEGSETGSETEGDIEIEDGVKRISFTARRRRTPLL